MATQITNYQCPACTGPLHFVGESGRLECDYCGSSFDIAEIEAFYAEKEAKAAEAAQKQEETEAAQKPAEAEEQKAAADGSDWDSSGLSEDWGADAADMKAYCCPSCGAELLCDATTAATSCPYCGNPSVLPGQFSGILKPDFVLPFKLSKEDAIKALKKHYLKKPLLPSTFSKANHLEQIKGVYVPFWMYDGEASGSAQFHATQVHTYTSGDYEITETRHYDVQRAGSIAFEKIPVDASSKMPDDYMDSIEPFDYADLKPFSTAYLPGFMADKYDVSVEDSRERADTRCAGSLLSALERTVSGYTTCNETSRDIHLKRGKVHYALLPVWILNTRWEGKDFLFAMNGQTGKLVGRRETVHIEMEQRDAAGEIFVDDGIGRARHGVGDTEALREAAGESSLACAEVPEVGDHIAGRQTTGQLLPQRLRFIGAVRGDLHHKSPLPAPLYLWHYTIPARQNQSAIGSPPKFCRNRLTRKLGGVIMMTRKLGRGGSFMEKEDILEISRREHQNRDLAELEASVQAGNLAGRVGAGVCCLVSALFVRAVHTVLLGPLVIYFSILGTHALVKFLKLKRKTDLVLTVLYLVMFLLFLVFFIRRLMEAAE